MDDERWMVEALYGEGLCCAQIILRMAFDRTGEENPAMMDAAAALCIGMKARCNCGALSGAAMMLGMADARLTTVTVFQLVKWFKARYGSLDCGDIAGEYGEMKADICLDVIAETYAKANKIMAEYGVALQ